MPNPLPSPLRAEQIPAARRPPQGGEVEVWVSVQRAFIAATQTGGSGQPCMVHDRAVLTATPRQLAVVTLAPVTGVPAQGGVVSILGADQAGAALSGQAELGTPDWMGLPAAVPLPPGSGFQVTVPAGKAWSRIDSVTPPAGVRVAVVALPAPESLFKAGCVGNRDISVGREARLSPTASPRELQRWLPGGELTVAGQPPGSWRSGVGMIAGSPTAVVLVVRKEGTVSEHILVADWMPSLKVAAGDGDSPASVTVTGPFAICAHLPAADPIS